MPNLTAPLTTHPLFQISRLSHGVLYEINAILEDKELPTISLLRILVHVHLDSRISPTTLATRLGLSAAAVSRQVKVLELKGYLRRKPGLDRRRVGLVLTATGKKCVEKSVRECLPILDRRLSLLSASEKTTLNNLLRKLLGSA